LGSPLPPCPANGLTGGEQDEPEHAGTGAEREDLRVCAGEDATWSAVGSIPTGKVCAVALIEHRWVIPSREATQGTGGRALADARIHPDGPMLASLG
jgi:hypothetical protein